MSKAILFAALLLAVCLGCNCDPFAQQQDPIALKGGWISFDNNLHKDGFLYKDPFVSLEFKDGDVATSRHYRGDQAIRVLRKWLDANYPEPTR